MIDKLFVYGTLRKNTRNSRTSLLGPGVEFAGYARMEGFLLDLGSFPGFVPADDRPPPTHEDRDASWVRGELYTLRNTGHTLPRLDRYEGCGPADPKPHLFERVVKAATLESGVDCRQRGEVRDGTVDAWVYVYGGPTLEGARVPSGDYARYRR